MTLAEIISAYASGRLSTPEVKHKIDALRRDAAAAIVEPQPFTGPADAAPVWFTECQRLNRVQQGSPVFWIHGAFGDASVYLPLARTIRRPFYGIQARGLFDDQAPLSGVQEIAAFYRRMIRALQPQGPYDIGGYSIGGSFAFEVARQLQAEGQRVHSLTLVDSFYPPCHKCFCFDRYDVLYFLCAGLIHLTLRGNPRQAAATIARLPKPGRDAADLSEDFVRFCLDAGVNKPAPWIRDYLRKMELIQGGYRIEAYLPAPLPQRIAQVMYFNNRGGLFYGQDAAHMNPRDLDPLQGVDYWSAWQQLLPNIEYRELAVDNHLLLFENEAALQVMRAYCEQIYHALPAAPAAPTEPAAEHKPAIEEKAIRCFQKLFSTTLRRPPNEIKPDEPMAAYGIDSLLATELTNQLQAIFGSLSITLFFEYRTLREIVGYFRASHAPALQEILGEDQTLAPRQMPRDGKPAPRPRTAVYAPPAADALDIAIIGLSGRYPGADTLDAFWQMLQNGRDGISEVPAERWDWRAYYTPDRSRMGRHHSKWGGFITDADKFDPLFFNISPREAEFMDPQERLFLEHAWAALEDAGYCRDELNRSSGRGQNAPPEAGGPRVGVYAGVMFAEYQFIGVEASQRGENRVTGGSHSAIANRVSYLLNLHGPSLTVDTACSSSLTSLHLACQDLKHGKTDLALAGGVNLSLHPNKYLELSQSQFISTNGRCESFGQGGNGYIPGEGVGVAVLKRLADAEKDGDPIYGVIKGSAINHGGRTNGMTVPNPGAQQMVIAQALDEAQVDPRAVSYIEAHGTGTRIGDPIEIAGLTKAFQTHTGATQYCWIGSVKSNIGHCEAAAGISGVTKVLLQMRHRRIAPSLHAETLNPHIDFDRTPFMVNRELRDWPRPVIGRQDVSAGCRHLLIRRRRFERTPGNR